MEAYKEDFEKGVFGCKESEKDLAQSMQKWLEVFKFGSIHRSTYDHTESLMHCLIFPYFENKKVCEVTSSDITEFLNSLMQKGYAYKSVRRALTALSEYFGYLMRENLIEKNPAKNVKMIRKAQFLSAQNKPNIALSDSVSIFTMEEIQRFRPEAFKKDEKNKLLYPLAPAYILMLNTGLRRGEMLGLHHADIDLAKRELHVKRSVSLVKSRDGIDTTGGMELLVSKPKTLSSIRTVPLNYTAVEMVKLLQKKKDCHDDTPLVCLRKGQYMNPQKFQYEFERIQKKAGITPCGLHTLRHTFATHLINGIKQEDGSIKCLSPREVADILGHSTSDITERYYVKRNTTRLQNLTDDFIL